MTVTEAERERLVAKAVYPTGVGPTGAALPPTRRVRKVGERDTHLLRLSLDLQLDAMLLVLGASAVGNPEDAMPWRRWLEEDVDLARALTTTALAVQGDLPSSLGSDPAAAQPAQITENLLARYTSMCGLLEDLLARAERRVIDLTEGAGGPAWHGQVRAALVRYQGRVAELRAHQVALSRGSAHVVDEPKPPAPAPALAPEPHHRSPYLPGELLG